MSRRERCEVVTYRFNLWQRESQYSPVDFSEQIKFEGRECQLKEQVYHSQPEEELEENLKEEQTIIVSTEPSDYRNHQIHLNINENNMSRFKTELCNNLIELGNCKYGDRCHYAHGLHELRQVSRRHPKYRTEKCKNFELTGKCPFGPRCSYVHPKPDLDSMIEQLSKYMQHTKAPKPDIEDEDDHLSLFTTTTNSLAGDTSTSISTCAENQFLSINNDTNDDDDFIDNDENKENQLVIKYQVPIQKPKHSTKNPILHHHHSSSPSLASLNNDSFVQTIRNNSSCLLTSSSVISTPKFLINNTINNARNQNSISSITRTPLGNSNILTSINQSENSQVNSQQQSSLIPVNDQINSTTTKATICQAFNGTSSNNSTLFESTSYESNKRLRLFSPEPSNLTNNTASDLFRISNPLSDYINNTSLNRRNPLQPNKQYYTRF